MKDSKGRTATGASRHVGLVHGGKAHGVRISALKMVR